MSIIPRPWSSAVALGGYVAADGTPTLFDHEGAAQVTGEAPSQKSA